MAKMLDEENLNIDHLESLDADLYRHLLYLKNYDDDYEDLGLDFTMTSKTFDKTEIVEQKPGGSEIAVTRTNFMEYLDLVVDHKLNKQIKTQCEAFRSYHFVARAIFVIRYKLSIFVYVIFLIQHLRDLCVELTIYISNI